MNNDKMNFSRLEVPTFNDVSVHDPGIIQVGDEYYVFGSHLAVAKTKDFISWEQIATNAHEIHPIFGNAQENFKSCLEWAESKTFWAPDMIELEDGRFVFYYNACRGDAPKSALGIAISDSIEGPFVDYGLILRSDMTEEPSNNGDVYDANIHPNVVDPHAFFDNDGKFWMVYGSFSGGIFILEMNPKTGFPLENQGYGTRLLGGNHLEIEGPYIIYAPETDYYYMFLTYGRLNPDGGYNMRIMRSKKPDGPYNDASGYEMLDAKGPDRTMFDRISCANHGSVIMRNHQFADSEIAFLSPGHNSVFRCLNTGRYLLIFHVRFFGFGFHNHQVRVHELFLNEDGWFVTSPHRYSGQSKFEYKQSDIVGDYHFIVHGRIINSEISKSKKITLSSDGTIKGMKGQWLYNEDKHYITIKEEGSIFKGIVSHQWNEAIKQYVITFSAMSEDGISIWGSKFL